MHGTFQTDGGKIVVNLKFKGAIIAQFGSQAGAVKVLRSSGIPGMTERRLSRFIHGYEDPRPEEARVIRKLLGVELATATAPGRAEGV